jgi:hypothetical protein
LQGLKVVLELLEVGHVDGKVWRTLLKYNEGLKWNSCCPKVPAYGHLKVVMYSFEGAPYFG